MDARYDSWKHLENSSVEWVSTNGCVVFSIIYCQSDMPHLSDYHKALGRHCVEVRVPQAAVSFNVPPRVALNWLQKYQDPLFHALPHGGRRNVKFSAEEQLHLETDLWNIAKEHPCWTLPEFTNKLGELGYPVNREFVRVIFKSWRWSWKKTDPKQPQKYSLQNMNCTIDFVLWVRTVPFARLEFMDESHFNSSGKFFVKLVLFFGKLIIFVFRFPKPSQVYWISCIQTCC